MSKKLLFFCFLFFTAKLMSSEKRQEASDNNKLVIQSAAIRYKKLGNWKGVFNQTQTKLALGRATNTDGVFYFQKPNLIRYELNDKKKQSLFISNGKEAWQVEHKKNKKPYVRHIKNVSKINLTKYILFLKGFSSEAEQKSLEKNFHIAGHFNEQELKLALTPKMTDEISKIEIFFRNNSEAPRKAFIEDSMGNTTNIIISSFKSVKKHSNKLFNYKIPKGADVEEL